MNAGTRFTSIRTSTCFCKIWEEKRQQTCIAPFAIMSSHNRLEFLTRLLRAPAALALVLSSSSSSNSLVRWGMHRCSWSYSLSSWYAAFPTCRIKYTTLNYFHIIDIIVTIDCQIFFSWWQWIIYDLFIIYVKYFSVPEITVVLLF